jgi:outer membrane protein
MSKPNKKTMKAKKPFLIIVLLLLSTFSFAGETYLLDLDKSISIAKLKSFEMLSLKQDLRVAECNLRWATSRFKTHINLNMTVPNYSKSIEQYNDSLGNISLYTSRKGTYAGGLNIRQPLPTDGSIYILSTVNNIDNYISNNRIMTLSSQIGIEQPINALYYNELKSEYKIAELEYEQSRKQLMKDELDLVFNVSSAFYNLLSVQKSEEIARLNLERQQDAYTTAKNKYDAGLIREVDALQMEVDLAEAQNNYDLALVNQSSAMNNFKEIIGISLHDSVVISSNLDYKIVVVDPSKAAELALKNRTEIRQQEIRLEMNKINIKKQKSIGMPNGRINAYYERIGTNEASIDNPLFNSVDQSYSDLRERPENFGIGLTISIPILDWGQNRALVKAAEARLQQNVFQQEIVKRNIESEVINLVAELNSSLKRLQLLEKNVKVAEKSFEIIRARFTDGDIDSQALALERVRLNNAYTSHLSAYINYQLKLADLMRRTFFDFENNRPVAN